MSIRVADVCVVIPSFNYARFLTDAVESVWRQRHSASEIIISDDGSTDESVATAHALAEKSPIPIKVIATSHVGLHESLNRSLRSTKCELFAVLAADDRWRDSFLARQVAHFADPQVVLAHCDYSSIDAAGLALPDVPRSGTPATGHSLSQLMRGQSTVRTGAVARVSVAQSFGGFDPTYPQEDWSFFLRCAARGALAYTDAPLVERRVHGANYSVRFAAEQTYELAYKGAAVPLLIELAPDESVLADALAFHLGVPLRMALFHTNFRGAADVLFGAVRNHPAIRRRIIGAAIRGLASLSWDRTGRRFLPPAQREVLERALRRVVGL